jgi:hypothetical protein
LIQIAAFTTAIMSIVVSEAAAAVVGVLGGMTKQACVALLPIIALYGCSGCCGQ